MPLNLLTLETAIQRITNKDYPGFGGYPKTVAVVAFKWMDAIHVQYVGDNLFPPLLHLPADNAGFVLWNELMKIKLEKQDSGQLAKAIMQYATALASAFAPPYKGIPPSAGLSLSESYAIGKQKGVNPSAVAASLAKQIDSYFRTGTAVDATSGTTIAWN